MSDIVIWPFCWCLHFCVAWLLYAVSCFVLGYFLLEWSCCQLPVAEYHVVTSMELVASTDRCGVYRS